MDCDGAWRRPTAAATAAAEAHDERSDDESQREDLDEDETVSAPARRSRPLRVRQDVVISRRNLTLLAMKREMEELYRRREELRALHHARALSSGHRERAIGVTKAYYTTFCRGLVPTWRNSIEEYVHSSFDHQEFSYGPSAYGVDKMMEQWRLYTRFFPAFLMTSSEIEYSQLVGPDAFGECDGATTVGMATARGIVRGVVSHGLIASVAPHILLRHEVMNKLLNKVVTLPCAWRFYFNTRGRVIRMDFDCDFMGGFGAIDGVGIMDLVAIMSNASISENSILADVQATDEEQTSHCEPTSCA